MTDAFWGTIAAQLHELESATTAADVLRILDTATNPYGDPLISSAPAFFAGSGGDGSVGEALREAGWRYLWAAAAYHWAMVAPNGDTITYIEGDIFPGNRRPM